MSYNVYVHSLAIIRKFANETVQTPHLAAPLLQVMEEHHVVHAYMNLRLLNRISLDCINHRSNFRPLDMPFGCREPLVCGYLLVHCCTPTEVQCVCPQMGVR